MIEPNITCDYDQILAMDRELSKLREHLVTTINEQLATVNNLRLKIGELKSIDSLADQLHHLTEDVERMQIDYELLVTRQHARHIGVKIGEDS